ncbi:MAG TPA: formate dehydrogenase accessory sulfurtransferase FdhD [Gammaproteobacteria bacterium]|nr:formate dehydrogenase accessory sulfurtransferase FdhD [Gammaproteobacteria bacterium]
MSVPYPSSPPAGRMPVRLQTWREGRWQQAVDDTLAVEAPLSLQVEDAAPMVTMRTPGHDAELAAGLLYAEGVVSQAEDLLALDPAADGQALAVTLAPAAKARLPRLARAGVTTSSCGVCGKADLTALGNLAGVAHQTRFPMGTLLQLPRRQRAAQRLFADTGGLHAAALFDAAGRLVLLREDVGRHNAMDKLVGRALLDGLLPLTGHCVLLSGRASFELLQKSIRAGAELVCAVSAPSSAAVELAARHGVTLVGFLREGRANLYTHPDRLLTAEGHDAREAR